MIFLNVISVKNFSSFVRVFKDTWTFQHFIIAFYKLWLLILVMSPACLSVPIQVWVVPNVLSRPRSHLSFCCQTKSEENQTFTLPTKCLGNFNTVGVGWQKVDKNQKHAFRRSEDSEYLLFLDKQNEGQGADVSKNINISTIIPKWTTK